MAQGYCARLEISALTGIQVRVLVGAYVICDTVREFSKTIINCNNSFKD